MLIETAKRLLPALSLAVIFVQSCSAQEPQAPAPFELRPAAGYAAERVDVFLASPRDVLLLDSGEMLISTFNSGEIVRFNPETGERTVQSSGHIQPIGLVPFDDQGGVFVSEEGGFVSRSVPGVGREIVTELGGNNTYATGVPDSPDLMVSQFAAGTVTRVTPGGEMTQVVSGLSGPEGLAFMPDGSLLIAEFIANRIARFDFDTGETEIFAENVVQGYRLRFDPAGNLWAAETDADRITRFAPDGRRETILEGINFPSSFDFGPDGTVYVTEFNEFGTEAGFLIRLSPPNGAASWADYR